MRFSVLWTMFPRSRLKCSTSRLVCTCGYEGETVIFGGTGRPPQQHASAMYFRMQGWEVRFVVFAPCPAKRVRNVPGRA